jgi:L-ascorbate metabolism protein UlaG (beta-lactamase superfamily)
MLSWLTDRFRQRPALERYSDRVFPAASSAPDALRVRFFGVSTLLFSDGKTSILIDGFFTRPGKLRTLFTKIGPDPELIKTRLDDAGVTNLAAVIVVHSHYDHALDAPAVVQQEKFPKAKLIGSASTALIAQGYGLPADRIQIDDGKERPFGDFTVRLLPSPHSPIPWLLRLGIHRVLLDGAVSRPLHPPACVSHYRNGGCYSVLIKHNRHSILVQGSGGFERGALKGIHADVVFLGIGTLGRMPADYLNKYWFEVVETVGAKRVFPIHWDDLTVSLDRPFVPIPLVDNFDRTMKFLIKREEETGIQVRLLRAFDSVDPFEDWR